MAEKQLKKVSKYNVMKETRENGVWKGYICLCNVNAYHVNNGWNIGFYIEIRLVDDNGEKIPYAFYGENKASKLEDVIKHYIMYNSSTELGKRVIFWSIFE